MHVLPRHSVILCTYCLENAVGLLSKSAMTHQIIHER
jgi:hypothetical protein